MLFFSCVGFGAYIIFRLGDPAPRHEFEFSPLTYEKFEALTNSTDTFSYLHLQYYNHDIPDFTNVYIGGGSPYLLNSMKNLEGLSGSVRIDDKEAEALFTPDEIKMIFQHLEKNRQYFFDGSEYKGLKIPHKAKHYHIKKNYQSLEFFLMFQEPGSYTKAWGINKGADEYPKPDDPLYDLFQTLEKMAIGKLDVAKPITPQYR